MFEKFAESLGLEWHGTDNQVRFQLQNFRNGFQLPAVAKPGKMLYRGDIRAPTRDANQRTASAQGANDGCNIRSKRDDSHSRRLGTFSITEWRELTVPWTCDGLLADSIF